MKILYIHQYFRTPEQGGALRSYYLAKALISAGHQVELITTHNGSKYYHENIEGIAVHYLPVAYKNQYGFSRRIISFINFIIRSFWLAVRLNKFDICYATSTPLTVGITALALKKIKKIPFYFEVRDLWPEAPIQLGIIKHRLIQKLLYSLEHLIYKEAEKIIALSPGIAAGIKRYAPAAAITIIPNMSDYDFFIPPITTRKHFSDPFYICYIGALGRANKLEFLINIAHACQQQGYTQIKFFIAGEGAEMEKQQKRAVELQLNNISWVGTINKHQVKELLATAHATYTSFDTFPVLETNSPNKFFDSLAAGKLTIVNTKGWLKNLVEQHACGFFALPDYPADFINKLKPYLEQPELLNKAQKNARLLAKTKFSRVQLSKEFISLFD